MLHVCINKSPDNSYNHAVGGDYNFMVFVVKCCPRSTQQCTGHCCIEDNELQTTLYYFMVECIQQYPTCTQQCTGYNILAFAAMKLIKLQDLVFAHSLFPQPHCTRYKYMYMTLADDDSISASHWLAQSYK